jgi:cytochrome c2
MKYAIPAALIAALLSAPAFAQSADKGQRIFRKCAACHKIGPNAKNSVGPVLTDVIGRTAGTAPAYKFSKSMRAAGEGGLVWSEETVFDYLANPTKYLRKVLDDPKAKAKMSFRLKKEADRRDVIAYLATFQAASAPPPASTETTTEAALAPAPADGFCIVNASQKDHFFAVETREGARQLSTLAPGEQLCSASTAATDGVVSVFESDTGFEGCSRIVTTGTAEKMFEYAEFDRCRWSSQDS